MFDALGIEINGAMLLCRALSEFPKFKDAVVEDRYLIFEPQVRQIGDIKIHTLPPAHHFGAVCHGGSKKKFTKYTKKLDPRQVRICLAPASR